MSLCPHGINIKHKRCDNCEEIAEAEMRSDIGGNEIPDRIEANEDWFDEQRGAESNAYTNEEAEARKKEWYDND